MRTRDADQPARGTTLLWFPAAVLAALVLVGCGSVHQPGQATAALSRTTANHEVGRSTSAAPSTRRGVPVPGRPVPATAVRTLTAIAARVAKATGDKAPVWESAVVTTHKKALTSATAGDTEPVGQETIVYLVTMKGHFVAEDFSGPAGSRAPTGTYLSIVINARTFESLDLGLSAKPPPVPPGSFGPVTYLKAVA
ncbi:MAG TPA: hypothetical protein VMA72_03600 [Streptosporangiaceae bacterium]|nr:hypothetical protein [Streptosporangiaceae bacterium]